MLLIHGIEPGGAAEMPRQAAQPNHAGFLIPMLNRTAGLRDFIRPHRGITHQHQAPIRAIGAQHFLRGFLGFLAPAIFAPKPFIRAVVEVVEFQMLEFTARGGK